MWYGRTRIRSSAVFIHEVITADIHTLHEPTGIKRHLCERQHKCREIRRTFSTSAVGISESSTCLNGKQYKCLLSGLRTENSGFEGSKTANRCPQIVDFRPGKSDAYPGWRILGPDAYGRSASEASSTIF